MVEMMVYGPKSTDLGSRIKYAVSDRTVARNAL